MDSSPVIPMEKEALSPRERLLKLKKGKNYNQLISQYGIDSLGTDDPEGKGRKTAKEKTYLKIDKVTSNQRTDQTGVNNAMDAFLNNEQELIDPRQITRQGDIIAAYDSTFLREYGREEDWSSRHSQRDHLKVYLESKGIDISEEAILERLEKHESRYAELTKDLSPEEVPYEMRTDAQRLSILENYLSSSNQAVDSELTREISELKAKMATYPQDIDAIKSQAAERHNTYFSGGIPAFLFHADYSLDPNLQIQSKSGRAIKGEGTQDSLIIRDLERPDFRVRAQMLTESAVMVDMKTANFIKEGDRHPDFRARDALLRSLLYLVEQGNQITEFAATWANSKEMATNRDAFEQALVDRGIANDVNQVNALLKSMDWSTLPAKTKKAVSEAATSTWTGKLLGELKFDEIKDFRVNQDGDYHVLFSRIGPLKAEEIPVESAKIELIHEKEAPTKEQASTSPELQSGKTRFLNIIRRIFKGFSAN